MSGQEAETEHLRATGEAVNAVILDVRRTGTSINDDPVVEMFLKIQSVGRPAYEAKITTLVSAFKTSQAQVGTILPIKIDPNDSQKIALDIELV